MTTEGSGPSLAESALGLPAGLFPFASRHVLVAGCDVHVVDVGQGPVLFMLHGNPTWSFLYRKLIRALAPRFRCVAIDLPGFGLSRAPAGYRYTPEAHRDVVVAVLDALDLRDATLVAHDWGGPIGLAAALRRPQRLTAYVLGNTWAWPVNGDWHFESFSALMGGPVGRWFANRWNLFVRGFLPRAMRRARLDATVLQAYAAPFVHSGDATGTHVFARSIVHSALFLAELAGRLGALDDRRMLLLWPDADVAFRHKELQHWQAIAPRARVVPIARCGHFLWEEADAEAVAAILDWSATLSRGPGAPAGVRPPSAPGSRG